MDDEQLMLPYLVTPIDIKRIRDRAQRERSRSETAQAKRANERAEAQERRARFLEKRRQSRERAEMTLVFDREQIRAWIEESTGAGLSVDDALPDTLAATAEALGLEPAELKLWIFDHRLVSADGEVVGSSRPASEWTTAALVRWARHFGLGR
jgi:predicted Zn-dependent protease